MNTTEALLIVAVALIFASSCAKPVPQPNVSMFGDEILFEVIPEPERNLKGLYTVKATCVHPDHKKGTVR